MSRRISYLLIKLLIVCLTMSSCGGKRLNKRVTLYKNDKIPYGTFYSYERIQDLFPHAALYLVKDAPTQHLNEMYAGTDFEEETEDSLVVEEEATQAAYIIIASSVVPTEKELNSLLEFIRRGNHVFISATEISDALMDTLKLKAGSRMNFYYVNDSLEVKVNDPGTGEEAQYAYPGFSMDNYLSEFDSSITTVIGRNKTDQANFVKFTYEGEGSIYIHLAPLAFSNFFVLHKNNSRYYEQVLTYLPDDVTSIYWDDYFRTHKNGSDGSNAGNSTFSKLSVFLKDEILRWPLYLAMVLFAIIYLFESKRKQKVVPRIAPLKNSSLDFVKTIGRLYYQRKDNRDLYSKMVSHFLGHVRNRYNIATSAINEGFAERLAFKSGYDIENIRKLLGNIQLMQRNFEIQDDDLLHLHKQFEHFYKNT